MDREANCPNCGRSIDIPDAPTELECPGCGALLEITADRVGVVTHPTEALRGEERTGMPPDDSGE